MAKSTPNQYPVFLDPDQRERLEQIVHAGHAPVRKVKHAQVLLATDHNRPGGRLTRKQVAAALPMHVNSVDRICKRFVLEGEVPALERKPRATPATMPKLDGAGEAQLVAICCGPPPEGRVRWTLRLLAQEMVDRKVVTQICHETVRQTLKKTNCSLGGKSAGACPRKMGLASSRRWNRSSMSTPMPTPTSIR